MQVNTLIGKKIYQKQGFLQDGTRVPLSGVVVSGNVVTQIKSLDKEGYNSLQLGIETKKKVNNAILGHVKKSQTNSAEKSTKETTSKTPTKQINPKIFREVRIDDIEGAVLGSEIQVEEVFAPGDIIDVTGVSKGKGWAGGVKRWGFHGGPRTHGQSDRERAPGSIGQTTTPGRVYKGKKMAGRMGSDTVTVKNLEVIEITADGVLLVKGLVPGRLNGTLMVKKVGENKKFIPLYKEVEEVEEVKEEAISEVSVDTLSEAPIVEEKVDSEIKEKSSEVAVTQEEAVSASASTSEANEAPVAEEVKEEIKEEKKEEPASMPEDAEVK